MNSKAVRKWSLVAAVFFAALALSACSGGDKAASSTSSASASATEKAILTFFTNNSDRTTGQGKIEQMLIDEYVKAHPNIMIKVETLSPDPLYQDKIKVYNASGNLPDIISSWGNTSFLQPLVNNNALVEIGRDEIKDLGFIPASLDSFSSKGKLYGFPRNSDFWVLYYNKKIFADNGISVPKTEAELLGAIDKLKAGKIVPISMDGQDAWASGIWFDTLLQRASGTWNMSKNAMDRTGSFKDAAALAAAAQIQKWVKSGAFGEGFLNQDYGTARNLFGQGKAAMFMMGEWEMGMAADANFPEDVRNNIGAFALPANDGGEGASGDLTAWFGGGYSVSNNSKHKTEAVEFLKWMFRPDGWAKSVWQNGVTFPAQKYDQFQTGKETGVQKDLTAIFNGAKSYSGTVAQDKFTPDTQKVYYDSLQKLEGIKLSPDEFAGVIDEAADKSAKAPAK